ncbi:MAG TPA: phage holin family protein, partial [Thermoanaerobaculia bacterium]|nr:phage holin family protein [Thermoanaerobaculia bacterium]
IGKNTAFVAAGAVVALVGVLPILAGIVIALGHQIGYATSALLVGIVITAIGAFLVMKALGAMKRTPLAPLETKAQVKETTQWIKEQMR